MIPLFFDLDGTITDPRPGFVASINFAFERMGRSALPESELLPFIGPPLRRTMEHLLQTQDRKIIEKAVSLYRQRLDDGGKFEADVYEGMPELLTELAESGLFRIFIATGKPQSVAAEIIEHFGFTQFFEAIHGSQFDGTHANKADLLRHIQDSHKLEKQSGLMIGDTVFDVLAGKENGIQTAGVIWGYGTREQLSEAGVHKIHETPSELRNTIFALV